MYISKKSYSTVLNERDWEVNLHIVIPNYGVKEFDVPLLKTRLRLLPEIAKLNGPDIRMQLLERISLFQKLDTIKKILVAEAIKLVKQILVIPASNAVARNNFRLLKELKLIFAQQ